MKKLLFIRWFAPIILFFLISGEYSNSQDFNHLYNLYKQKEYFKFRNQTRSFNDSSGWQRKYLLSISYNLSGKYKISNDEISDILNNENVIPDSLIAELYKHKIFNHINLFEYSEASKSSDILLTKYLQYLDKEELEDSEEDSDVWKVLKDYPPQKSEKPSDVKVKLKKDIAGLLNIPVKINGKEMDFIFDTGANFSVIVESLAMKLGFNIIDAKIKVGTATGIKVESRLAVLDRLEIGKASFNDVVFLVMPDESLTFGSYYKIEGIIGNPVMRAFEEIRINKDLDFFSPVNITESEIQNLTFESLTPVVEVTHLKDSLSFIFDTGAGSTLFFQPYFKKYEKDITDRYEMITIKIGGAGGFKEVKGYRINDISLGVGNKNAVLDNVSVLCEFSEDRNKYFYGNLGQDFISNFDEMTINFKYMFLNFK